MRPTVRAIRYRRLSMSRRCDRAELRTPQTAPGRTIDGRAGPTRAPPRCRSGRSHREQRYAMSAPFCGSPPAAGRGFRFAGSARSGRILRCSGVGAKSLRQNVVKRKFLLNLVRSDRTAPRVLLSPNRCATILRSDPPHQSYSSLERPKSITGAAYQAA